MRLPTLPRRWGPLRRREHGDRRGAARPRQRHGPGLLAALPLRPTVSVARPPRACGPLRSHGDRAAWDRRGAATDRWSRRVARARGDLRGSRARGHVRLVTSRVPHHPRTPRCSAPGPRCRCPAGPPPPPTSTILAGRPAYVLLRDPGRRRGTRRRSQAGGLGAGPEGKRVLAAWVHPARRLARNRCIRQPQATRRTCGNHAFRGVGTTRDVGRGSRGGRAGVARRRDLPQPSPPPPNLHNRAFRPGAARHRGEILGAMPTARPRAALTCAALASLLLVAGCERPVGCSGEYCGTMVIASGGEPDILLPPVSEFSITRDVTDQLFLKLADLGASGNTIGDEDFQPQLAQRWEWDTPTTLVFHLDPRARWQDGPGVTAADVAFTYDAYTDTLVNSSFRSSLRHIAAVTTRDSLTVVFRFRQRYPEMFYDAVYHMRILPAHLLREVPREQWRSTAFGRAPVGDGPYRFVSWKAGESIELAAAAPAVRRSRPAAGAVHGDGPRAAAAQRVRRVRQGPARSLVAVVVDLGSGDPRATLRQRPGGAAPHPHRLDRHGRRRHPRQGRQAARLPPAPADDECHPAAVRAALAGAIPDRRRRRAAGRSRLQPVQRARAGGPVRRAAQRMEHRPDTLVGFPADVDSGRIRALQLPTLREPGGRPAGGPGGGVGREPRPGTPRLAGGRRDPQPGRARHFPVRYLQRRGPAQADRGRDHPARFLARAAAHVAHSRRPTDGSRPRGALGGGVAGAPASRVDRHRVRGRHHHVLRRSPRPRYPVRV